MPYQLPAHLQRLADQVPAEIRCQLTDAELLARITEAHRLQKSAERDTQPVNYRLLTDLANAMLRALPAAEVNAEAERLRTMAANCSGRLAGGYYKRAHELERNNPQPTAEQLADATKTVHAAQAAAQAAKTASTTRTRPAARTSATEHAGMLFKATAAR